MEQIAQIKEKVSAEKGWDAAQQKLIYSGSWIKCKVIARRGKCG
jgi:hypothetical protein